MSSPLTPELPAWQQALGEALAESLPRLLEEPGDPLLGELLTALTTALCRGDLVLALEGPAPAGVSVAAWPDGHRAALAGSRLLQGPDGPLLLNGRQLAWRRWAERQEAVLAALLERLEPASERSSRPASPSGCSCLDDHPTGADPDDLQGLDPQQRRAVQLALRHRLVLILGGPGTGKTSTLGRLLAAVRRQQPGQRVVLAAPTGKAAARLRSATGGVETCSTLHRLLESRGDGFGRHRLRPLELDLLVVDELSMVDLELMEALIDALPPSCHLVLVGDPAQLPPIAPGGVLQALQAPAIATALQPVRVELRTRYRNDGAIAHVAATLRTVIDGSAAAAMHDPADSALAVIRPLLMQLSSSDNLQWLQLPARRLPAVLLQRLASHRQRLALLAAACWPGVEAGWSELLAERDRLLVLTPRRRGRWGLDAIHQALLGRAGTAAADVAGWPCGTPVLCRRNLPALGLANGDLGVLVVRPEEGERGGRDCRILFGQEAPLWLHPAQLAGALEPALALTVHKAQGSEARELIVLLDDASTAEPRLLYTALTRAREQALLISPADNGS